MAATAYASAVSLLNTLDQIHTHPLVSTFFDMNQTKSLSQKVNFFVDFMEKYSDADSREVEYLVHRIADAAHDVENIIEVHAADRVRGGESPSFLHNLQQIMEKMESTKEEVVKFKAEIGKSRSSLPDLPPSSSSSSSSSSVVAAPPATSEATTMVGFEDYANQLFNDLTGHDVDRQVISVTGMGGIGKTTLARNIFANSHIVRHFNVRVWVTVSQQCSPRNVFLQAFSCLGGDSINMDRADDRQLSDELHKKLFNQRYLIVLDDVWSVEIWDKIKFYFPENNNGSRIVVTTREAKLVTHIGSFALGLKFLDKENSWKLFCEKTFPRQDFPPELEDVGKKIVLKCGGLPLAISVIGGLLRKSPSTQEYWEKVAKDKSLILKLGENSPLSILYLSYKYLPVCLKSCFLYFGYFEEDVKILISTVLKLWVAEGFLKANKGQSLEEVAESYLNDLVDRNLILFDSSNPYWKRCSIHDLVRDLCIMIGEKEKFFCVQRSIDGDYQFVANQIRAGFYHQESHVMTPSILHPLIVAAGERAAPFKTRLLRVLCNRRRRRYQYFGHEVNVRFLQDYSITMFRLMVSQCWSLQTLIVEEDHNVVLPAEIWKMPHIRHIDILYLYLPDPPPPASDDDVCVLQNLQTLKRVHDLIFTEEVCRRIPNIKELKIKYDFTIRGGKQPCYHLENISGFNELESLEYSSRGGSLLSIKFPSSLKKLTLSNCKLEWGYMADIASLPHLEFVEFDGDVVAATEWVFADETFVSLKCLYMSGGDYVTKWIAQSSNFPVLEELLIYRFRKLDRIPSSIGEIPTLQSITLDGCNKSVNISGVEILHEQQRFENLGLRLLIKADAPELLEEEIQELGLTCQNLQIKFFLSEED